jgi:hypothetical protein
MISHEHMQKVVQREFGKIVGRRIVAVEPLTREQALALGFDEEGLGPHTVLAVTLDDGSLLLPTDCPEGNGPGWLELMPGRGVAA